MLESNAVVPIDRPTRWAKQLADHFSHKVTVEDLPAGRLVRFAAGEGLITSTETAVLLCARAETADELAQVQDVLGRHLERFAQREGISVSWE